VATLARADAPRDDRTSRLVVLETMPEPPRQHDAWQPPATRVPRNIVAAARVLFEQGFADPRSGAYCEIEVEVSPPDWTTQPGVARTHGWVLPVRPGDDRRFAVCWNGLTYRLLRVGKEECLARMIFFGEQSLRQAVRQFLGHYHGERNHQGRGNRLIDAGTEVGRRAGAVHCCERLGGILRYYYRPAA
jgi:hypothetical protein